MNVMRELKLAKWYVVLCLLTSRSTIRAQQGGFQAMCWNLVACSREMKVMHTLSF